MDIGDFDIQRKMDENARCIIGFIAKLMRVIYAVAIFVAVAIVIYAGIALVCLLCSCTSTRYVPVESEKWHTDTVIHYIGDIDSVTVIERVYEGDRRYDSIAPILDSLNRVIGWDRYHFREVTKMYEAERTRLTAIIDSLRAISADTVRVPVPYPVERKLNKWEQTKQDVGGYAIVILAVVVCVAVVWIARRFRRR